MQTIEIKKGVKIGFDDLIKSVSRMDTVDLKKVLEQINQVLSVRSDKQPNEFETQLLQKIKEVVPSSVVRRYRQLHKKQQIATITPKESKEMLLLTDFMEEKSSERVMLLGALAKIRKTNISELAEQLGIREFHAQA